MIQISTDQVYSGKGPHIEKNVNIINQYSLTRNLNVKKNFQILMQFNLRTNFFGNSINTDKLSFSDKIIKAKAKNKSNIEVLMMCFSHQFHF